MEERRVDQIEREAAILFWKNGYDATSLRDIAKAVGIQPATIYHHYESKQDLLVRILIKTMDVLIDGGQRALMEHSDPSEQLREFVRRHVKLHGLRPEEGLLGDTELRAVEPERRHLIVSKRDEYQSIIGRIIEYGERFGAFDVPDRRLATYAIIEMCNQVGLWFRPDGRLSIDEIAEIFADLAIRLVSGEPVQTFAGAVEMPVEER